MQIQLNGNDFEIEEACTVSGLVEMRELNPRQIAVEVNEVLVQRENYDEVELNAGDQVELVSLAGGG